MKRLRLVLLLAFALVFATGCYGRHNGAAIFATGLVIGSVLTADRHHEHEHEHVTNTYVTVVPAYAATPPSPPSPRDRVRGQESDLAGFDAKAARSSLAAQDVAKCRETGAPSGYGHAKVTFNPSGETTKVVIDEPNGLTPAAAKCIGDELGKATVPEFKGSLVTVGTTWFVR